MLDLVSVMAPRDQLGASPKSAPGASGAPGAGGAQISTGVASKIDNALKGRALSLTLEEIKSEPFQKAIQTASVAPLLLPKIDKETLRLMRKEGAVPRVPDSEEGAERAFRDAGIKSRRQKIKVLLAVYSFLDKLGSRDRKDYQKGGKIDPAAVAASAVWMAASTAIPGLRIAKNVAMKVIKSMVGALKLSYNNSCGGRARQTIGDFSDVGSAGRQEGRCQAADGEPKWIDTGFAPYVWKTAVSTSKWSYSPLGISKSKSQILELLDKRKKRGKKAPPAWGSGKSKKGDKNLRPLPAALKVR